VLSPSDPDTPGRLDAIERAVASNRSLPDPEVELRLLELRHKAFRTLPVEPGLDHWPPRAEDLFPQVPGVPEVAPPISAPTRCAAASCVTER
jgi:hypothetical protein